MREIKFRAWCVKGNGYIAGFNLFNYHGFYNKGLKKSIKRYDKEWIEGEYILEQYTGKKDINDKEIYENDIVNHGHKKYIIKYWENMCAFMLYDIINDTYDLLNGGFIKALEKIGNIHENPDLLNA